MLTYFTSYYIWSMYRKVCFGLKYTLLQRKKVNNWTTNKGTKPTRYITNGMAAKYITSLNPHRLPLAADHCASIATIHGLECMYAKYILWLIEDRMLGWVCTIRVTGFDAQDICKLCTNKLFFLSSQNVCQCTGARFTMAIINELYSRRPTHNANTLVQL